MKGLLLLIFSVLLVPGILLFCDAGSSPARERTRAGPTPKDLADVLAEMARSAHIPVVAELAQPLPMITGTENLSLNPDSLNQLAKQTPEYEWKLEGKTVHFYNKKLRATRFNFLSLRFPTFTIPPNLSNLKLWFPGRAIGLLNGFTGEGGATTGFGDSQLEKEKLQRVSLENVTGLEVLLHVTNESPSFYTILVFPNASPTKVQAERQVTWFWGSLDGKPIPLHPQPAKNAARMPSSSSASSHY